MKTEYMEAQEQLLINYNKYKNNDRFYKNNVLEYNHQSKQFL